MEKRWWGQKKERKMKRNRNKYKQKSFSGKGTGQKNKQKMGRLERFRKEKKKRSPPLLLPNEATCCCFEFMLTFNWSTVTTVLHYSALLVPSLPPNWADPGHSKPHGSIILNKTHSIYGFPADSLKNVGSYTKWCYEPRRLHGYQLQL